MKFSDNRNLEGILIREENLSKQEELGDLKEWSNWNGITFNGNQMACSVPKDL